MVGGGLLFSRASIAQSATKAKLVGSRVRQSLVWRSWASRGSHCGECQPRKTVINLVRRWLPLQAGLCTGRAKCLTTMKLRALRTTVAQHLTTGWLSSPNMPQNPACGGTCAPAAELLGATYGQHPRSRGCTYLVVIASADEHVSV